MSTLQGQIPRAAKRLGLTADLADLIHKTLSPGEYLHCTDLALRPEIAALGVDAADLSVLLSDAYRRKLVGRRYGRSRHTLEKFMYGHLGETSVVFSHEKRSVIKAPPKRRVGYDLTRYYEDSSQALSIVMANPGCRVERGEDDWAVTVRFATAEEALPAVCALVGIKLDEVME